MKKMKKLILLLILLFSFLTNAQKAITVTTELKAANIKLFRNYVVGSIRSGGSVPHTFSGVTANYARTDGYHTLPVSVWIADGFRDWVTPSYDVSIERLGAIFYDSGSDTFTHPIIALTQQEQDDYQQNIEDNDASSQSIQKYKNDGVIGFDRAMALIKRRFDNGVITGNQARGLAQGLYPVLEPLYKGMWRLVKDNIASVTPPANADLLDIFNKIKNGVDSYVANNF